MNNDDRAREHIQWARGQGMEPIDVIHALALVWPHPRPADWHDVKLILRVVLSIPVGSAVIINGWDYTVGDRRGDDRAAEDQEASEIINTAIARRTTTI